MQRVVVLHLETQIVLWAHQTVLTDISECDETGEEKNAGFGYCPDVG
jgi:hypothetical protein